MSLTYPTAAGQSAPKDFLAGHDQLKPFLLAVAMVTVSILVALAFTGLPA